MRLVLDIENTISYPYGDKELDNSPFNPDNKLVSVGIWDVDTREHEYLFFHSKDKSYPIDLQRNHTVLQDYLDKATLLIGHNIKYDLLWIRECGFKYDGPVWDTAVFSYVLFRGRKLGLSLDACCERAGIEGSKLDILSEYLNSGQNTDDVPVDQLREYGIQDIHLTARLFLYQQDMIRNGTEKMAHMMKAVNLMHDVLPVLTDMERAGVAIDSKYLHELKVGYSAELKEVTRKLNKMTHQLMGDRPVNLDSPDDMSRVLYSRVPKDKAEWREIFNIGAEVRGNVSKKKRLTLYPKGEFEGIIKSKMWVVPKVTAIKCPKCSGKGTIPKLTKQGVPYKRPPKCKSCSGLGVRYIPSKEAAGLRLRPANTFASQSGFATNKDVIEYYLSSSISTKARTYLQLLSRYNKLTTWVGTFIPQLEKYTRDTGLIHCSFNQCVTSTGRLSCTKPNLQNQSKRDPDFKLRKAFISRFEDGRIYDADFGQLEFRIAAFLSGCEKALQAVRDNVDIHSMTRDFYHGKLEFKPVILQPDMTRQEAKAECVPMDSLILTRDGWKDYHTLEIGEEVLGYNQELDQMKWTRVLDKVKHKGIPTVTLRTKHNWEVTCTSNHRWYGEVRRMSEGIRSYDSAVFTPDTMTTEHHITVSAMAEGGDNNCTPDVAAFIGWLYSDGSIQVSDATNKTSQGKDGRRVGVRACILQKKYTTEVMEVLSACNIIPTRQVTRPDGTIVWYLSAEDTRRLHIEAGLDIRHPDFVKWVLSLDLEARYSFLDAVFLAEGHTREYDVKCVTQNVGPFQEAIHIAAFLEGHDVRLSHKTGYTGKDCVRMTLRKKRHVGGQRLTKTIAESQDVWCPRTELGSWVMKQGGTVTITGNTFGPLYGKITEWTKQFYALFPGIKEWHNRLMDEAVTRKEITTPSGRVYSFPDARRFMRRDGELLCTYHTQIKNYPVQGFATGDIVLLVLIDVYNYLKERGAKSLLNLQVHDSATVDAHPDEFDLVEQAYDYAFNNVYAHAKEKFGIDLTVPLSFDLTWGYNWLEQQK